MRYGTQRILPRYASGVRKWDYGRAVKPRAVFIHIMEGNLAGTDQWFRNPMSGVTSTHFGIGYASWLDRAIRRVSVYQWVDTNNTAWGTGVTRNPVSPLATKVLGDLIGRIDVNHALIHIEVEGYPGQAWPSGFVTALNKLLLAIGAAHGPLYVMRHHDVSTKICPGSAVPWTQIKPTYGQRLGQQLPDTSSPTTGYDVNLSDVTIPGDAGRIFDVKAGTTLYADAAHKKVHYHLPVAAKYALIGFHKNGDVLAANPNNPGGNPFLVPPKH